MLGVLFALLLQMSGFIETFSDTTAAHEQWLGDWSNLTINRKEQLQNHVDGAAESLLIRASDASVNAEWSFWTRIYGGCSAYNLTRFYLMEDEELQEGYYVQVGGTNKNVTLYRLHRGEGTKVIEDEARVKGLGSDARVNVRLTRSNDGAMQLYSLVEGQDTVEMREGSYWVDWLQPIWVGLMIKNSKERGTDMYFDSIVVRGEAQQAPIPEPQPKVGEVTLALSNECLSLNGDGYEDEVRIDYTIANAEEDETGYWYTSAIYDADGIIVRDLGRHLPMDASGSIVWDGKNRFGQKVTIGIYIAVVEITNERARPVRERFTIAVLH